jgi:uncharacterized protein YdeI (YjbR/CyaY-like superfamily)
MATTDPRVDAYIAKAPEFAQPVLAHLRGVVHAACPGVEETIKWGFPNFLYEDGILCNMAAFKNHCSFGFWKAALMDDTDNILEVAERAGMGHMGKITSLQDLPKDAVLKKYIKAAMKLNKDGIKVPKAKPTEQAKKELEVPNYFVKELKKHKQAEQVFNAFAYSHKKEYLQWITEAKTEVTRNKRMAQAMEWIADGKGRNWKY